MVNHNGKLDIILSLVHNEVRSAQAKFGPYHSSHEGMSVIREEVDELWDEVKHNKVIGFRERQLKEAIQVASTAVRFIHDLTSMGKLEDELAARHDGPTIVFRAPQPTGNLDDRDLPGQG